MSFFYLSALLIDEGNIKNCILRCQPCDVLEKAITFIYWKILKVKTSKWKGLDKDRNVYDCVDWKKDSAGLV